MDGVLVREVVLEVRRCVCPLLFASVCQAQLNWWVVGARGGRDVGQRGLVIPFGLCGFKDLWMRRAMREGQL